MGKAFEENEFTHNLGLDQTSLKKSTKPLKCRLFGRLLPSEVLIQRTGYQLRHQKRDIGRQNGRLGADSTNCATKFARKVATEVDSALNSPREG